MVGSGHGQDQHPQMDTLFCPGFTVPVMSSRDPTTSSQRSLGLDPRKKNHVDMQDTVRIEPLEWLASSSLGRSRTRTKITKVI